MLLCLYSYSEGPSKGYFVIHNAEEELCASMTAKIQRNPEASFKLTNFISKGIGFCELHTSDEGNCNSWKLASFNWICQSKKCGYQTLSHFRKFCLILPPSQCGLFPIKQLCGFYHSTTCPPKCSLSFVAEALWWGIKLHPSILACYVDAQTLIIKGGIPSPISDGLMMAIKSNF